MNKKKEEELKEQKRELTVEAMEILIRDLQSGAFAEQLLKAKV